MRHAVRRIPPELLALCVMALLPACRSAEIVPKIPGLEPYRITVQQGNYISQEMIAQLKLGMTREQVRFVLGTPLLTDVFHADRWDYVYYRDVPGSKREQRNLSVMFEKDRLTRVIGDLVPPEGVAPQPTGFVPQTKPDAPAKPAAAAAKPAPETPAPAAAKRAPESAKPLAEPHKPPSLSEPAQPAVTGQNWSAASDQPEAKPAAAPAAGDAAQKPAADAEKPAAEGQEPGFFGRLRQKIGL